MALITQISDYNGEQQLQRDNSTEAKFNVICDQWETSYIYKLLGVELGKLFIADLDSGVPVTARFLDIYNAIAEDDNGEIKESRGIKEYLKGVIWFYYSRNNPHVIATGGNKSKKSQNSNVDTDNLSLARIYNRSINDSRTIQWYICKNSDVYPEYNGQEIPYLIGL